MAYSCVRSRLVWGNFVIRASPSEHCFDVRRSNDAVGLFSARAWLLDGHRHTPGVLRGVCAMCDKMHFTLGESFVFGRPASSAPFTFRNEIVYSQMRYGTSSRIPYMQCAVSFLAAQRPAAAVTFSARRTTCIYRRRLPTVTKLYFLRVLLHAWKWNHNKTLSLYDRSMMLLGRRMCAIAYAAWLYAPMHTS